MVPGKRFSAAAQYRCPGRGLSVKKRIPDVVFSSFWRTLFESYLSSLYSTSAPPQTWRVDRTHVRVNDVLRVLTARTAYVDVAAVQRSSVAERSVARPVRVVSPHPVPGTALLKMATTVAPIAYTGIGSRCPRGESVNGGVVYNPIGTIFEKIGPREHGNFYATATADASGTCVLTALDRALVPATTPSRPFSHSSKPVVGIRRYTGWWF